MTQELQPEGLLADLLDNYRKAVSAFAPARSACEDVLRGYRFLLRMCSRVGLGEGRYTRDTILKDVVEELAVASASSCYEPQGKQRRRSV